MMRDCVSVKYCFKIGQYFVTILARTLLVTFL